MAEVLLICGKICSGKSYLARQLMADNPAVLLSVDEITRSLFPEGLGDKHDAFSALVRAYLLKKAGEIVRAGSNVIIDWGFWTRAMRREAREALVGVPCRWYYLDIPDDRWEENIRRIYGKIADSVIALQDKMGWYREDRSAVHAQKWQEIREVLSEAPSSEQMTKDVESIGLDAAQFEAMYGKAKIEDALKFGKDLKDRYSVLWMYYDLLV